MSVLLSALALLLKTGCELCVWQMNEVRQQQSNQRQRLTPRALLDSLKNISGYEAKSAAAQRLLIASVCVSDINSVATNSSPRFYDCGKLQHLSRTWREHVIAAWGRAQTGTSNQESSCCEAAALTAAQPPKIM